MFDEPFALTRLAARILDPLSWVWVLAALGLLCALWPKTLRWRWPLWLASLVWLGLIGWEPSARLAYSSIEDAYPDLRDIPSEVVGMIVLGGGAEGDSTLADTPEQFSDYSIERLSRSLALARNHPGWTVVFTGEYGKGSRLPVTRTEAQAALGYWQSKGMPPNPVELEQRSHNTAENAFYTAHLLGPRKSRRWLLVTSGWHMPRAMAAYRAVGVNVVAYPVDRRIRTPMGWARYSLHKGRIMWHMTLTEHAARLFQWWQLWRLEQALPTKRPA